MVVSGLPTRNGNDHAKQIAQMSLAILREIGNFKISHLPTVTLEARIGLHSGILKKKKQFPYKFYEDR